MRVLRDNWLVFTIVALLLCVATILLPQLRLLSASVIGDGGRFSVVHRNAGLEPVPEMSEQFQTDVVDPGKALSFGKAGKTDLEVSVAGPLSVRLSAPQPIEPSVDEGGKLSLQTGKEKLVVSQQAPRGLFNKTAPAPLTAETTSDGSVILHHAANAYITFDDTGRRLTLSNYVAFFTGNETVKATINSLFISITATALAALIGVTLAYVLARFEVPATNEIVFFATMASVSPPFLGAYSWRLLLGRNGVITNALGVDFSIVGIHGVIWVIAWLVFPVIFLLSYSAFRGLDASHVEAAESLGANPAKARFSIEIPLAMPGIITGLYLATMAALSDFGTPRIIGLDISVLPVLIYTSFLSEAGRNPALAATGSVVLVAISSLFLMAQQIYLAKRGFSVVSSRALGRRPLSRTGQICALGFVGLVLFFAFVPHMTVLVTSFMEWRVGLPRFAFTLSNYTTMLASGLGPAWVTLSLGIAGTAVAFAAGLGIAFVLVRKRYPVIAPVLSITVMMPYVIPGTVLGIGLIMMFNKAPLLLTGTWFILALAYVIRNLPFTVKASEAALRQVHPALDEAAISLGAKPLRVFVTITAPLMLAGAVTGATLTFLHIVTELSSTIVLYRPPWKPMTAVIFENTLVDADFGVSAAQTILLMMIIYIPLYLVVRYGQSRRIEHA
ncbi:ABC transporter permease [Martelella endophytica]|uniref:Iron ABC transporter permease n=1 Tax=Martelella endophytica TaxID=1486262 RepID=A0A0D5LMJ3_MAREN|nr:iron ABC transporter permease [Martelella endophytica]AJY45414.1 iron ABC transporter permease [Martelella endophytica]